MNLSHEMGEVESASAHEGEGDRAGTLYLLWGDPITLTLGAARHRPLPRSGRGLQTGGPAWCASLVSTTW